MRIGAFLNIFSIIWYNVIGLFCLSRWKCQSEIAKSITFIHGCVCLINGFCIFLGLANLDKIHLANRDVAYLRYVEWTLCTPMMTYEMCLASRMLSCEIKTIVALTVAFCICGSIAAFTSYQWTKIVLGIKGTIYCVIVLYKIGHACFNDTTPQDFMHNVGYYNFIATVLVWPLYICSWGLGPDVLSIISANDEDFAQQIFSLILKSVAVAYSILTFDFDIEAVEEVIVEIANFAVEG